MEALYSAEQLDQPIRSCLIIYSLTTGIKSRVRFFIVRKSGGGTEGRGTDYAAGQVLLKLCVRDGEATNLTSMRWKRNWVFSSSVNWPK